MKLPRTFSLASLALLAAALAPAQTFPSGPVTVTTQSDGTLRTPTNFWAANASSIAAAAAGAFADNAIAIGKISGLQTALDAKLDDSQASAFGLTLLDDDAAAAARATLEVTAWDDSSFHVFGREHLVAVHDKMMADLAINIRLSGDSTTAGGASHSELYDDYISALVRDQFAATVTNAGHGGKATFDWIGAAPSSEPAGGYLATDLAAAPDLYVIRWGANDVVFGRTVEQFLADLESGLQTIRAAKTVAQMSVLLMTPNTMYDPANGRDDTWFRGINAGIRSLARQYQCAFIDTYSLGRQAQGLAGITFDDPFGDGRAIHPKDVMNLWIAAAVEDLLIPSTLRTYYGNFRLRNLAASTGTFAYSITPSAFAKGIQMSTAQTAQGHPFDGFLVTFLNADKDGWQIMTDRANTAIRFRMGSGTTWRSLEFKAGTTLEASALPSSFPLGWSGQLPGTGWPSGTTHVITQSPGGSLATQYAMASGGVMRVRTGLASSWSAWSELLSTTGSGAALTGITAGQVANTPAGTIAANTVQGALNEIDSEKAPLVGSTSITTLGTVTTGTWTATPIGSSYGGAGTVSGLLKANGSGVVSAAVAGTDYLTPTGSGAALSGITGTQIANTPAGTIAATTVQGGLAELDGEKEKKALTATATLDFGSLAAGASESLTVSVTGATVGYSVALGLPAAPAAGIVWTSHVSAADTVTIIATRAC